jgi:hypothetical protein
MLAEETAAPLAPKNPLHTARQARHLPVHAWRTVAHDTFDPSRCSIAITASRSVQAPLTFAEGQTGSLFRSPWQFKQYGQSGCR